MQVSRGKDWVSLARPLYVQRPEQSLDAPVPRPQRAASTRELRNQRELSEAPRGRPLRAPSQKGVLRRLSTVPAPRGPHHPLPPPPPPRGPKALAPVTRRGFGRNSPRRGAAPGWKGTKPANLSRPAAPGALLAPRPGLGETPAGPLWYSTRSPGAFVPRPETGAEGGPGASGSGRLLSPWAACTHRHGQPRPLVTHHLGPAARAAAAAGSALPGRCVRGGSYRGRHGSRQGPNLAGTGLRPLGLRERKGGDALTHKGDVGLIELSLEKNV